MFSDEGLLISHYAGMNRAPNNPSPPQKIPFLTAVIAGALYGILCQLVIRLSMLHDLFGVMSFGYVFILPVILSIVTLWYATPQQRRSWLFRICAPCVTMAVCLVFSLLVGWEGAICFVMAAVVYAPLAMLGGIITGIILTRLDKRKIPSGALAAILALPLISAYLEQFFELSIETPTVETEIEIDAPPSVIWKNIIRVPPITEPLDGYFYRMGFPKPVEATLSYEGIGGVRKASFERGLLFIETIDVWDYERKLSFAIKTDPESTPPTTLDSHVMVGGRYFDVLRGTYEIVPTKVGTSKLMLSSNVRVSTRFNFYAGIWARFLMSDIQRTILRVLKTRSETAVRTNLR